MNAQDLMIGNLIYQTIYDYKTKKPYQQVINVALNNLSDIHSGMISKSFAPIPITPEWLERAEIEKLSNLSGYVIVGAAYWKYRGITFHEKNGKYYMSIGDKLKNEFGHIYIEFDKVHELQNIFAVAGVKLEFK